MFSLDGFLFSFVLFFGLRKNWIEFSLLFKELWHRAKITPLSISIVVYSCTHVCSISHGVYTHTIFELDWNVFTWLTNLSMLRFCLRLSHFIWQCYVFWHLFCSHFYVFDHHVQIVFYSNAKPLNACQNSFVSCRQLFK